MGGAATMPQYESPHLRKLTQCAIYPFMLKAYLQQAGETQAAFAERVSTTPATISRLVAGTLKPSLELALEIDDKTQGKVPVSVWRSGKQS